MEEQAYGAAEAAAQAGHPIIFWVLMAFLAIFALITLGMTFFTVPQQSMLIVQRFGKFAKTAGPGLNVKIPWIDFVAGRKDLRIQQLDVSVETKTKDNVFVHMKISVQYEVVPENVFAAFYRLSNPEGQINSYVFDVVRAEVPKLDLDEVFARKDDVANAVKNELETEMNTYGYRIVRALVTDVDPDAAVKQSMNAINAAQRQRIAASEQGEAERILQVKRAEAEAESKRLQGEGIANQRKAIIHGLRSSVEDLQEAIPGATGRDAMALILTTQHYDTIQHAAGNSRSNVILLPYSPDSIGEISRQLLETQLTTQAVGETKPPMEQAESS